jgi:hypothetical protein
MPPRAAPDPALIGHQFNDWTVRAYLGPRRGGDGRLNTYYECQCKCGVRRPFRRADIRAAVSLRCRSCATSRQNTLHGMGSSRRATKRIRPRSGDTRFKMYQSMLRLSASQALPVDPRWRGPRGFLNFLADMDPPRRHRGYDLRRIDTSRGYGPDNCKVVKAEKRPPVVIDGITYTIGELAFIHGIHPDTLAWRLRTMDPKDAVSCPVRPSSRAPAQPGKTSPRGSQTPSRESRP